MYGRREEGRGMDERIACWNMPPPTPNMGVPSQNAMLATAWTLTAGAVPVFTEHAVCYSSEASRQAGHGAADWGAGVAADRAAWRTGSAAA